MSRQHPTQSAVRRVTCVVIQSVMLSPCGRQCGTTRRHPGLQCHGTRDPQPPGRQHQGTPDRDPQVAYAREPTSQHETSDNEASSDDEDQWEDLLPAIDDTPAKQPSQKATARQLSVTKKTKVCGKK